MDISTFQVLKRGEYIKIGTNHYVHAEINGFAVSEGRRIDSFGSVEKTEQRLFNDFDMAVKEAVKQEKKYK